MNKYEYLLLGIANDNHKQLNWLFSILSVSTQKKEPSYDYPLKQDRKGYFVVIEGTPTYLVNDDKSPCDNRLPLFKLSDRFDLKEGAFSNVRESVNTTVGLCLANCILSLYPFGDRFDYVNDNSLVKKIKSGLVETLAKPGGITINEYYSFVNAYSDYLAALAPIVTITSTEKTIVPPPGVHELRDKLVAEYKQAGRDLNDPLVYKEIEKAMTELADEYLKDEAPYGNFLSGKVWNIAYRKTMLAKGLEMKMDGSASAPLMTSLSEPSDLSNETIVIENNSTRVGSYARAKETVKGGITGKWIQRFLGSLIVAEPDCGTTKGLKRIYRQKLSKLFGNSTVLVNGRWVEGSEVSFKEGVVYTIRSPMYCQLESSFHYCEKCMGEDIAANPDSLLNAGTELSFSILNGALKRMHSTGVIVLSEVRLEECLS